MIDGKVWLLRWGSGWVGPCIPVYISLSHFTYMLIKINKHAHIEGEMDALFFSSRSVLHTPPVRPTKFGIEHRRVRSCPWCWKLVKLWSVIEVLQKKRTLQTCLHFKALWRALKSHCYLNVDPGTHASCFKDRYYISIFWPIWWAEPPHLVIFFLFVCGH